jgi:anaerobic selenocysteine-containing dehydrogenase
MSPEDAKSLGLASGRRIRLVSDSGEFVGRVLLAPIRPGNLAVHFPEGMALLSDTTDPESGEPDYNASVRVVKLGRAPRSSSRPEKER